MRKSGAKPIETPADARECVRGSSALVDGVRLAYALWPVEEKEARKICKTLSVTYASNRIVKGAVVKANDRANREIQTYVRGGDGLLHDRTGVLRFADPASGLDLATLLIQGIAEAAKNGQPLTRTGVNGLYDRRAQLPLALQEMSKHKLVVLVDDLLNQEKIVQALADGSKSVKWLDVPDGPFAKGVGEFIIGAMKKDSTAETTPVGEPLLPVS